jgi:hypothetical protein
LVAGIAAGTTALAVTGKEASANYFGTSGGTTTSTVGLAAHPGVLGVTNIPNNIGVAGSNTNNYGGLGISTPGAGVYGHSNVAGGSGVFGNFSSTSLSGQAVLGQTASTNGRAILGKATSTSGVVHGVVGETASSSGFGVWGSATATSGATSGVKGLSSSSSGVGVRGETTATVGATVGVLGSTVSSGGTAVKGFATATSGSTIGVHGVAFSGDGIGVSGDGGLGGEFSGDVAPLRLVPSNRVSGIPGGTHQTGELLVNNTGDLLYCKQGGTPGTWVRLNNGFVAGTNVNLTDNPDGTTTINALT